MSEVSNQHSTQHAFQVIRECLAQGQRAMDELGWTQRDVMAQATLGRLEEQLETTQKRLDAVMSMLEAERPPEEVFAHARSLSNPAKERQ